MNAKAASQRYQRQVLELAKLPGNDVCADCRGRNPRWASWNLGIFLCVHCAGIHRKIGTHVTKVKSLTLDEWTKEQVERMRELGNIKSNEYFNPDEMRNRPPANVENGERDSELERFVRNKYEYRKFMNRLPPPLPNKDPAASNSGGGSSSSRRSISPRPSYGESNRNVSSSSQNRSTLSPGDSISRARTAPIVPNTWKEAKRAASPLPALPPEASEGTSVPATTTLPSISVSTAPSSMPPRSSTMPFQQSNNQIGLGMPSQPAFSPQSGLYPSTPALPLRASSAQGISGPGSHNTPATPVPNGVAPSSSFQGRSSVFDDLLALSQPPDPQISVSQHGFASTQPSLTNNGWMQQTTNGLAAGQQPVMPVQTGVGNPWAHMQQQQLQQQQQTMTGYASLPAGMGATGLGNMAFGQHVQQPLQAQGFPMNYAGAAPPSPTNPFFQQQNQQQLHTGGTGFGYFQQQQQPQATSFVTTEPSYPGQQPTNPQYASQMMAQQRFESGQVFDDWAKGMMPGRK